MLTFTGDQRAEGQEMRKGVGKLYKVLRSNLVPKTLGKVLEPRVRPEPQMWDVPEEMVQQLNACHQVW